jgi:hypothetical protein
MILMSRVEGPDGAVTRELSTLLDPNFAYSVIFSKDAFDLGYTGPHSARRSLRRRTLNAWFGFTNSAASRGASWCG